MGSQASSSIRQSWREICESAAYRGRWVALDQVRYEAGSSNPSEGEVVDADEDLAALCGRMRDSHRTACAIVFCEAPASARSTPSRPAPARAPH